MVEANRRENTSMSEHLPVITEDNLTVVVEKEIGYFKDLLKRCKGRP